jgi:serine/threonine-protein phosphatase with EF-hand domain
LFFFLKNEDNIIEQMYKHKKILQGIFRAIDTDNSGLISKEEFRECCQLVNSYDSKLKLSNESIEQIADTIDFNKDGLINLNEFLEAFRIICEKYNSIISR